MNPRAQRSSPPYVQITDHYRAQITDGDLDEGAKLPAISAIADEWGVATATAAKAVSQLGVEGLVRTSPRGTFVAARIAKASSPRDRALRARSRGTADARGETSHVTAAAVVQAPPYVADLFGLEDEVPRVVRREWVTVDGEIPVMLSVSWWPASLVEAVPELLSTDPTHVAFVTTAVEGAIGPMQRCRDFVQARESDAREAGHLKVPVGTPVLAGTFLRWPADDQDQLAEYGEYVLPPRRVISWDYELPDD